MKSFDQSREEIAKLCRYFSSNRNEFLKPGIKEAHVRLHLIDPFFECLGWDVRNTALVAPQYREVVTEDSLEIEGTQKAPDYSFRVGTLSKYFGEAKKCGININADPLPAYQLRRYGWSAKVPLSILTDFEEFGVYDCSARPKPADKASFGRLNYFRFDEYPDRWRELWDIFSRQAVWEGSFDKYAASRRKRGTSEVDSEFLKEIEGWREALARNIALRNLFLSPGDLNSVVQRTIDRVIFLRMAEDRGSEPYGQLLKLCEQPDIYKRFIGKLCRSADEKYNSGLFHFQKEEGIADIPDFISVKLQVDDKVFKPILQSLYFEHGSPYHFGILPVELLGTVYERFLGKVIRLTPDHRAKVEEKPEVRKAGGVYYTPAYIVDYIVKNTVGKMIEGKSPVQLARFRERQPLRVLDMACGSGSFLLGAFKCLLDYSLKWYAENNPEKFKKEVYKTSKGEWRLSIAEKKRLLTTHIFGVDIDPQAVEVSKLSLLLKVMEGETDETVGQSRQLFHERALPNLSNNIKCGNSLIGPDYFSGRLIPDPDEMKHVNPFDWNREFPEAMKSGGFDCVIGNPPYGALLTPAMKKFLSTKYPFVSDYETSQYFLTKSEILAHNHGFVSFIIPNTIFLNLFASKFRNFLVKSFFIERISNLDDVDVFNGATVRTSIPILKKGNEKNKSIEILSFSDMMTFNSNGFVDQNILEKNDKNWSIALGNEHVSLLRKKIEKKSIPLKELMIISQGLIPYDKYRGHDEFTIKNRIWHSNIKKDASYKRELRGGDVTRYSIHWNGIQWISYGPWLAAPRKPEFFTMPRLLFREITDPKTGYIHVSYTEEEFYNNPGLINCISRSGQYSIKYILGLCASRLLAYLHFSSSPKARKGVFPKILVNDVRNLPIRSIDFSSKVEKRLHDQIVNSVNSMLALHNVLAEKEDGVEKLSIQRQINSTDCDINCLVYELYGLTIEEIKIVEGESKK